MDTSASTLGAALDAAALGIAVFPVWGVDGDGQCDCPTDSCASAGKHPIGHLAPHGHKDATLDPAIITQWWSSYPTANIGGRIPEGMIVVDVDTRNEGASTLQALTEEHGMLPHTRMSWTGNGMHVWLTHAGPAVGKLGKGLDVKTNSGYVVLPGSSHKSGSRYQWGSDAPVAPSPTWLVDLLTAGSDRAVTTVATALPLPLSPKWEHHVRTGDLGHYPSRSDLWAALVHPVIAAGGTVDDFLAILSNPAFGIYARWRDLGSKAEREARYIWNRYAPDHEPGKPSRERVAAHWDAARPALIDTLSAKQRPGYLAAWWAITELAITHQTYAPMAPVRSVAELAGLDKGTASAAERHMVKVGLLQRGAPEGRTADDWTNTFTLTNNVQTPNLQEVTSESVRSLSIPTQTPPWLPAWRNRTGWGKAGWLIDGALTAEPITDQQIMATSGVSLRTFGKLVPLMTQARTAVETDDGWIRGPVDPALLYFPDAERAIRVQLIGHDLERRARRGQPLEWTVTDPIHLEGVA